VVVSFERCLPTPPYIYFWNSPNSVAPLTACKGNTYICPTCYCFAFSELQIIFYFKEYSPLGFEIKGYFAFQKKSRGYLENSHFFFFCRNTNKMRLPCEQILLIALFNFGNYVLFFLQRNILDKCALQLGRWHNQHIACLTNGIPALSNRYENHGFSVRIRVRIGPPHPLVCCKRRLDGRSFG
jgi:hypothetical protein